MSQLIPKRAYDVGYRLLSANSPVATTC